jgi:PAS domain S-box-containing protein
VYAHVPGLLFYVAVEADGDFRFITANNAFREAAGLAGHPVDGRPVRDAVQPQYVEPLLQSFREAVATGRPVRWDEVITGPGGARYGEITLFPESDEDGACTRLTGVGSDITGRKELEEQFEILNTDLSARAAELEAANIELEAFNYSASHDLRGPLTVINSYCQIIQDSCGNSLDDDCNDYLVRIIDGTMRMSRLIDTLLNFSRIMRVDIRSEPVDLSSLARLIADELAFSAPERIATFRITDGIRVYGDSGLLRLVMDNLLGNAWKYSAERDETIIDFGVTQQGGATAYYIRDNGAGFAMKHARQLFTPFKRFHDGDFSGHGIGLATVDRIIRRHGGRIWAVGEPGTGATFYFTLPLEPPPLPS